MDITAKISFAIVAIVIIALVIKKLVSLGVRILMGILTIVCIIFITPKINTILINKISNYGIIERKLSEIVDGDMNTKVRRDYELETGQKLEDESILETLKAETFKIDYNLCDEMNILLNAGFPQGINNTLLLNFSDIGGATIEADSPADYVAKFFVIRITNLISLLVGFGVSTRLFG
ncbi:MAG: hypothetical protein K6B68_17490 [Eubacterium sp.]|nr:hypothetical protein [Eubacterium sp.]